MSFFQGDLDLEIVLIDGRELRTDIIGGWTKIVGNVRSPPPLILAPF